MTLQHAYNDMCRLREQVADIRHRGHAGNLLEFNQLGEVVAKLDELIFTLEPIVARFPVDLTTGIRSGLQDREASQGRLGSQ